MQGFLLQSFLHRVWFCIMLTKHNHIQTSQNKSFASARLFFYIENKIFKKNVAFYGGIGL